MVKEDKLDLVPANGDQTPDGSQTLETPSFKRASQHNTEAVPEDIPPGLGQYEDFHTIDWQRDMARDRQRHRQLARRRHHGSMFQKLKGVQDASSGWICVLFVACLAGACAAMIDIGSLWMFDLKLGVCEEQFWFNKEHCCWTSNESTFGMHDCGEWQAWSSLFGMGYNKGVPVHAVAVYIVDYFVYVALALLFAAMAAMYVRVFAPYASGGGIAEIKCILSGFIIRGYLGKWTLLIKTVGLMLSTSTGLNLGKEGPMVHVACCCGNVLAYFFPKYGKNEAKKREILSASAAAGISVAFGTPIGGILFSLEEVSYYFPLKTLWRSFFCALVAAFVLRWFNPFGNDHLGVFYIDYSVPWYLLELIPFILLGAIGGIWGAFFIRANMRWCRFRKASKLGKHPFSEIMAVTLINGLLAYPNPYTRISLTDLIRLLVMQCGPEDDVPLCDYQWNYTWPNTNATSGDLHQSAPLNAGVYEALWQLSLALIFRIVIFVFTAGIKIPAGTFIPSMAIGAIIGRLIGIGMEQFAFNHSIQPLFHEMCNSGHPCVTPGIYAMVGAAAALGGVTRMTVSLVVIMFEVTGGLQYIVPLMAAVMTSKWVGDAFGKEGLADAQIRLNGFPFLDNKEECLLDTLASDVIHIKKDKLCYLTQDSMTVEDVEHLLLTTSHNGYPVIVSRETPRLVGYGCRRDLLLGIDSGRKYNANIVSKSPVIFSSRCQIEPSVFEPLYLWRLIDAGPITVTDDTPMEIVIEMFRKLGLRQIIVTRLGELVGVITKKDILRHLAERQHKDPDSIMFD